MCRLSALLAALVMLLCSACSGMNPAQMPEETFGTGATEFRGIWVSTVINLDYPSKPGLDAEILKNEAIYLLDQAGSMGMNAVVLQVRPCGDAIYPSEFYPWSEYVSGKQGVAAKGDIDLLEFWIEEAHQRGLELHAWINPFRVTRGGTSENPNADVLALAENNPAHKNPEWAVEYKGNLYLNPGLPQVREYIKDGVREILENYDVDGIHFDDYFYPGEDFDDAAEFSEYGAGFSDIADWRRDNVNKLVSQVDELVDEIKPTARFGISPFAIWQNRTSSKDGSDTKGLEAYHTYCADSRAWVKNQWLDYIAPQIYWSIGNEGADYEKLLSWWVDVVRGTDVELYIGHAGYRSLDAEPGEVWYGGDEIKRQIKLNRMYDEVKGSIHFRIGMYLPNTALVDELKSLYLQS